MTRLRMEVEGTERVAELMEQATQKALELQEAADKLGIAAVSLRLSGTPEGTEKAPVTLYQCFQCLTLHFVIVAHGNGRVNEKSLTRGNWVKLKQLRQAAQMTQTEVAARLRINRSTVAHWEQERNGPKKRILPRVAELYNCLLEDLPDGGGEEAD